MAQVGVRRASNAVDGAPRPRLERSRSDRVIGGVAAGIGQHLGIEPTTVRIAFVLLSIAFGFGIVVYLLTWLLAPQEALDPTANPPARRLIRPTVSQALGAGLILVGVAILLYVSGFWFGEALAWPVTLAAVGFAILWARSGEDRASRSPLDVVISGRRSIARVAIGSLLILGAGAIFLGYNAQLDVVGPMLLAAMVAIGGLGLIGGPWIWSIGRDLIDERSTRIRSEERAEMAAHLHDSVLQTLALIQRAPASREMASLARTQERELRAWLYGRAPTLAGARLRDAIDAMAGRVEREQQVKVEAIVVGDSDLDERTSALVAAVGEATLNAARHSGATEVSVYVEVEDDATTAYVRDLGSGFDPDKVAADRRGIADSIVGRLERHGGTAEVTSRPGAGTEVVMRLPRKAKPA
ncbi:MAG TPA: PspC domain-containing protein [Candidatus Limnocylindria bacterium]|nr:PspC domain-containing protein [Candidatus Limnocylindria bacterium]